MELMDSQNIELYAQQYDPNNDFAIFGVGNSKLGGVQTMQEKMNMADENSGEDESSDDTGPD